MLGATLTASCTPSQTGTGVGAVGGGLLGHAVGGDIGMLIGAVAGGALGYSVGRAMEEEDRRRAAYALEQNRTMGWRNPDTGDEYRVEPYDTRYSNGRECRDFRMFTDIEGRTETVNGTACRRPDGQWEMVSG